MRTISTSKNKSGQSVGSPEKAPLSIQILYATGQFGWSLAAFGVMNLIPYFYMPPEEGSEPLFPVYIFQGAILGFAALIGIINFSGRFFDAITDPLIANWSDRSGSRFGRRRKFMALGAIPFAFLSVLVFVPLTPHESILNAVALTILLLLFYFFMTLYVTPYTALISELGHNPTERLNLSTYISVAWASGFLIGNMIYSFQGILETWFAPEKAFQLVLGAFALIALIAMMLPVLFLDENRYCLRTHSSKSVLASLRSVLSNRNFRFFAISDLLYWMALTFIQVGISYYVIVLLGMDKSSISVVTGVLFILSFLSYPLVNLAARKMGKKKVLSFAFAMLALCFGIVFLLGRLPFSTTVQAGLLVLIAAVPIGIFGILPNAVIADIAEEDGKASGEFKAGMFFATRTFLMKSGISLSNLIFPTLLLLGKSRDHDTGLRVSGLLAMLLCIIALYFFKKYKEVKIV